MKLISVVLMAMAIVACSDEPQVDGDHVWKDQTDMIDKAKALEQQMLDAAKLQQQKIDEQTR